MKKTTVLQTNNIKYTIFICMVTKHSYSTKCFMRYALEMKDETKWAI